jgi:hypothetical protein
MPCLGEPPFARTLWGRVVSTGEGSYGVASRGGRNLVKKWQKTTAEPEMVLAA